MLRDDAAPEVSSESTTPQRAPAHLTRQSGEPLRVLVVDDEPSICQVLTLALAAHGVQVTTAQSASEAKLALDSGSFDALLLDLRLRDGRGDAVFRSAVERCPALQERTLFMTGDISTEAERTIAKTNCPYLLKPFDITLAVQAIAALVGVVWQGEAPRATVLTPRGWVPTAAEPESGQRG